MMGQYSLLSENCPKEAPGAANGAAKFSDVAAKKRKVVRVSN